MTPPGFDGLPPRLRKLVPLLANAATNAAIADALVLSLGTVEQYVSEMKESLRAEDRGHLVLMCHQHVHGEDYPAG